MLWMLLYPVPISWGSWSQWKPSSATVDSDDLLVQLLSISHAPKDNGCGCLPRNQTISNLKILIVLVLFMMIVVCWLMIVISTWFWGYRQCWIHQNDHPGLAPHAVKRHPSRAVLPQWGWVKFLLVGHIWQPIYCTLSRDLRAYFAATLGSSMTHNDL